MIYYGIEYRLTDSDRPDIRVIPFTNKSRIREWVMAGTYPFSGEPYRVMRHAYQSPRRIGIPDQPAQAAHDIMSQCRHLWSYPFYGEP